MDCWEIGEAGLTVRTLTVDVDDVVELHWLDHNTGVITSVRVSFLKPFTLPKPEDIHADIKKSTVLPGVVG